jgi:hypothetical protein
MTRPESTKTVASRDEERIIAAVEAATPIHEVKYDEAEDPTTLSIDRQQRPDGRPKPNFWKCRKVTVCIVFTLSVGLIVAAAMLAVLLRRNKAGADFDIEEYIPKYSLEAARRNSTSPQARALAFINATSSAYPPYRLRQRYALAVLYFSGSVDDESALKDENECKWFSGPSVDAVLEGTWGEGRDICSKDGRYSILVLAESSWNGTIPSELEMLDRLQYLSMRHVAAGSIPTELYVVYL